VIISRSPVLARVLLVDDEVQQLAVCAQVMKVSGFSVITACGPFEAIRILVGAMKEIDVAILDYDMPVMNGCILARRLRSICPWLKIILYSGTVDIPQSKMTSVDAFIPKGDGVGTLIDHVVQFARATAGADISSLPRMEA